MRLHSAGQQRRRRRRRGRRAGAVSGAQVRVRHPVQHARAGRRPEHAGRRDHLARRHRRAQSGQVSAPQFTAHTRREYLTQNTHYVCFLFYDIYTCFYIHNYDLM